MTLENDEYSFKKIVNSDVTGEHASGEDCHVIIYPIGKYEVSVRLSSDGHFLGIDAVQVNKSFLDYKRLSMSGDSHDIDEFYKER